MEGEAENPVFALAPVPLGGVTPGVSSLLGISVSTSVKWEGCPKKISKTHFGINSAHCGDKYCQFTFSPEKFYAWIFFPMALGEIYTAGRFQWETTPPLNLRNKGLCIPEHLRLGGC